MLLNDGTEIEGPEATKDALQIAQSKQPRWFIKTSLLEERYWEREDEAAAKATDADIHSDRVRRKSGRYDDEMLKADLQLAQQKIESQQMTIETLKGDKQFLQAELENRRGEIDKLRGFFESVGEAADSAARLKQGAPDHVADGNAIDGSVVSTDRDRKRTVAERYFPTVVGIWQRFRPTQ